MRFRRSHSLVMSFYEGEVGVHNFVTQSRFSCSLEAVGLLSHLDKWRTADEIVDHLPDYDLESLSKRVYELVWLGAVVIEGTPEAEMDRSFRDKWQWGMAGGYLHFMTRDAEFPKDYTKKQLQANHLEWGLKEPNYYSKSADEGLVPLSKTDFQNPIFGVMRSRRSNTSFKDEPIELGVLADCLFAGNGMIEIQKSGHLAGRPLKMSPSAEACNPYELYVYSRNVKDLPTGFYHYLTGSHALKKVSGESLDLPGVMGGQEWTRHSAAVVLMVAQFPRTMWTLHKPLGYRMVLMEAGFVGQNITLAATEHGLSAVPIGSFSHSKIEPYLSLPPIEASLMLCVALGQTETP